MATINHLPNETLVSIFEYLQLAKHVHIDEVCRKWSEQKLFSLSKRKQLNICEDKEALHWFESPTDVELLIAFLIKDKLALDKLRDRFDRHTLYTKQIPPKMVDNITKLMPNLTVIRTQQEGSFNELWKIKLLLEHYCLQLVEVNIRFVGTFDAAQEHLATSKKGFRDMLLSLFTTLNNLEKLDILVLWLQIPKNCRSSIEMDLSVANRLQVLRVFMRGFDMVSLEADFLAHTYQTYAAENENLQQLGGSNRLSLETLRTFGRRVFTALRELHISDWICIRKLDAFKQIAQQCPNLEVLSIGISYLSIAEVAEQLLPCRSLVHLEIDFHIDDGPVVLANGYHHLGYNGWLPVLSSVKFLVLSLTTASHRDLEKMNLEVIFPNVQGLQLLHRFNRCQLCSFTIPPNIAQSCRSVQTAYSLLVHQCQRLARPYFGRFSQLTKLIADIGQKEIPSSFKKEVHFTPETLDQETYEAPGNFINVN